MGGIPHRGRLRDTRTVLGATTLEDLSSDSDLSELSLEEAELEDRRGATGGGLSF
jgi:hypothetical protein